MKPPPRDVLDVVAIAAASTCRATHQFDADRKGPESRVQDVKRNRRKRNSIRRLRCTSIPKFM